jgi:hypothetical protein
MKITEYINAAITHPVIFLGSLKGAWLPWIPSLRKRCTLSYCLDYKRFPARVMQVDFNGRKLRFNVPKGITTFDKLFTGECDDYKDMDVKGKKVLDIGGSWGDTAVYFSLKGADEVISYEMQKDISELGEKNIALNGIPNARMIAKPATAEVVDRFAWEFAVYPKVLKLDCEGCEYPILRNAKRLRDYEEIILEYHEGNSEIKKLLEHQGFNVSVKSGFLGLWIDGHLSLVGVLYAKRK